MVFVMIIFAVVCAGCDGPSDGPLTPTPTPTTEPTPQQLPDLSVASVDIFPSEPRAGERFTAIVHITNKGSTPSGDYDLAMNMKDVSHDFTYPVGTFRQSPLQPGEQVAAWSSDQLMVNEPGAHQFWVEIEPFNFNDGNEQNNKYGWTFTVSI